ncbi:Uncharacterised protein [Mycobacteroides abscessus subsp. abscessus]|nr:Uncharacterised protein [Mycobacteroides abscessus subsp. abscessus]
MAACSLARALAKAVSSADEAGCGVGSVVVMADPPRPRRSRRR